MNALTNVLVRHIAEDKRPLGLVIRNVKRMRDHLVHRGDAAAPRDAETPVESVGLVFVLGDGPLEEHRGFSGGHSGHVRGELAVLLRISSEQRRDIPCTP
jgi:hypothetical protein